MTLAEAMDHRQDNDSREPDEARTTELAAAYVDALLSGDEVTAEVAVREAMDAGLTTAEIDEKLIAPAMWLVGELWEQGRISVADEHIATEITVRVLALQGEAARVARSRRERRVMLAAPAGERHVVALRMVANLLHGAGYGIVMLGHDVPPGALAGALRRHRADVICMSATMPGRTDQVLSAIDEVRQQHPAAGFVLGGRGIPGTLQIQPEVALCDRVSEAVDAVDAMVRRATTN